MDNPPNRTLVAFGGIASLFVSLGVITNTITHTTMKSLGFIWSISRNDPDRALPFLREHPVLWGAGPLSYLISDVMVLGAVVVLASILKRQFPNVTGWSVALCSVTSAH